MRRIYLLTPFLFFLLSATSAQAQIPNPSVHFGVFGGYHLLDSESDLREAGTPKDRKPESGADFGVRIGYNLNWLLGVELQVEDAMVGVSTSDEVAHALNFRAGLAFHFLKDSPIAQPYAVVGAGLYSLFSDDLGDDVDYLLTYGLGLKLMITQGVAFRMQVDHVIHGDGISQSIANNFDFTGGFDFFVAFADETPPPPPPDKDGDGVLDADDRCPLQPGTPAFGGCPDTDGDGVVDVDDRCMSDKGPVALAGCPDSDGDGIIDLEDRCPTVAGIAAYSGCADTDGDGIADDQDQCPLVKGVIENGGCPAAPAPEVLEKFTGAMRGITFETNKAKVRPTSFTILDEAVAVLQEFPDLRLIIEGHTDSRGSDSNNMKLSQARADSVKAYLLGKGISSDRIDAIGYGETREKASNDNETGRAENRRIEFQIIQPSKP